MKSTACKPERGGRNTSWNNENTMNIKQGRLSNRAKERVDTILAALHFET